MTDEPIVFDGVHCKVTLAKKAPGLIVISFAGRDIGEFGSAPMEHVEELIGAEEEDVEFFIDARETKSASMTVSGEWATWLKDNRHHFDHVSMLTGSPFIRLTADFVRRFADLGDVMRLYSSALDFDDALSVSLTRAQRRSAGN